MKLIIKELEIIIKKYDNGRPALLLFDGVKPEAHLSVNIPSETLTNNHCMFLKESPGFDKYSERLLEQYDIKFTGKVSKLSFVAFREFEFPEEFFDETL